MGKIGFFGGCFNPPTNAHLEIARAAIDSFKLDRLIVIPMGDKYEKTGLISFNHRYNMLNLLFANDSKVEISKMQQCQAKKTYAIDTFEEIDREYSDDERFFIMGIDNFSNISQWKNPEKLLNNRNYIVLKRGNVTMNSYSSNIHFLELENNISSTLVRSRIKHGENLSNSITLPIVNYINKNRIICIEGEITLKGKIVNFCMALLNLLIGATILVYVVKIPKQITDFTVQEYNIVRIIRIILYAGFIVSCLLNSIQYFLNSRNAMRKTGYLISVFSVSFVFIKEWPIAIFSFLGAIIIIFATIRERWVEKDSFTIISIIAIIAVVLVVASLGCVVYKSLGTYILNKQNENELSYKQDYFRYVTELNIGEPYINVRKDGKYGYIKPDGTTAIEFEYDYASPFVPIVMYDKNFQIALVCQEGSTKIILKNKREVLTYRSESMNEDYEAKLKELENVYYNTLGQTEKMHYEIDTKINNNYVVKAYKEDNTSYTYRYDYNDEYDVIITQSSMGFGDTYELASKENINLRIKLECENLAYDENYLYVYSNGNIPFFDVSDRKQGWFTRYGKKVVLVGKAQILEIVGEYTLIKNHNNNTIYFINSNNDVVSDVYKEIFICGNDRYIVKNSKNKYVVINSSFEKVFDSEWDFVDTSLVSAGLFVFGTSKEAIDFNAYDYAENMNLKILDFDGNVVAEGVEQVYNKYYYISGDTSVSYSERYSKFLDNLKVMKYEFPSDKFYK